MDWLVSGQKEAKEAGKVAYVLFVDRMEPFVVGFYFKPPLEQ